jgi:hypothetical protein
MTKNTVTIVAVTSGILYFFYLIGLSKLGNKKDLNTNFSFDNNPLFVSDNESGKEEIMGGSRKRKNKQKKRKSLKYLKNN